MFDLETWCVIRDYRVKALSSNVKDFELNPRPFLQRFALNTTLTLCYGIRMDDAYDELLREILCTLTYFHSVDDRCGECHLVTSECLRKLSGLYSSNARCLTI